MKNKSRGFTLVEIMLAGVMAGVFLTFCTQFFLTQLNQYYLISGNSKLSEQLRTFSKYIEKDVHNSLEFYVFADLSSALNFTYAGTTFPKVGNCLLLIQERGMIDGGKGVIYYVGSECNSGTKVAYYPLYRALVTFSAAKKINEAASVLNQLVVGHLKKSATNSHVQLYSISSSGGIFYETERRKFGGSVDYYPHITGCRHGLYVGTTLMQPGLKLKVTETPCNFCFYSRNPRF
ncbi:MAG: prepilin-type N-terminal cleavage/methylation domain-containing protein [Puniceicoccales bacterium]|jgi:hypothetical protein|nr:prepilin-type N-terminal cleavage/methylation domain-containing protein [Puniceicoccales bacterium]